MTAFYFILIGLLVGAYGTLIGVGGGFALIPLLLILYPRLNPDVVTGISLAVIFLNAFSGTVAYSKMKRIDFRTGIIFSIATCPGAVLGVWAVKYIPRNTFDLIFGVVLTALAVFLIFHPQQEETNNIISGTGKARKIITSDGKEYNYKVNETLGTILSFFVGFFSSVLGLGGGVMHIPILVYLLKIPCHIATATSHFILVVMTLIATLTHLLLGDLKGQLFLILELGIGVIIGAQIGARLSKKIHSVIIIRLLAVALIIVAVRLLFLPR